MRHLVVDLDDVPADLHEWGIFAIVSYLLDPDNNELRSPKQRQTIKDVKNTLGNLVLGRHPLIRTDKIGIL